MAVGRSTAIKLRIIPLHRRTVVPRLVRGIQDRGTSLDSVIKPSPEDRLLNLMAVGRRVGAN